MSPRDGSSVQESETNMNAKRTAQQILDALPDDCTQLDIQRAFAGSIEGFRQTTTLSQTREYFRVTGRMPTAEQEPLLHQSPEEAYKAWQDLVEI